jgi:hypothetical protein
VLDGAELSAFFVLTHVTHLFSETCSARTCRKDRWDVRLQQVPVVGAEREDSNGRVSV